MAAPIEGLKSANSHKISKLTVVYMDGDKGPFKCSHCEYFSSPNACEKVKGFIDPEGCCDLYDPEDSD